MDVNERRTGDRRKIANGSTSRRRETHGADITRARRVEAGLRTLAEASSVVFYSLDSQQTLTNVAAAVARTFATWCLVYSHETDHQMTRVAAVHRDPTKALADFAGPKTIVATGAQPLARALRGDSTLTAAGDTPQSTIVAPIRVGPNGDVIGAIVCARDASYPLGDFIDDDVRFAAEIALRAGLAFDHARDSARDRLIAVTLQEASLPKELPVIDGIRIWAEFRAGKTEATIGGDWYDAFPLEDGRIAVTIGDVFGSGLNAAVTMGKVRQSMRAFASFVPFPNAMLDVADRVVREEKPETYPTALAGIFNPATEEFTFASAGHHPPMMRHADGTIEDIVSPGVLLGLRPRGEQSSVTIPMPPGSAIFFFTDGLVEFTRDLEEGRRHIHRAIAELDLAAESNPAHAFVELVLHGRPAADDVAVLVAAVKPHPPEVSDGPQSPAPERYLGGLDAS